MKLELCIIVLFSILFHFPLQYLCQIPYKTDSCASTEYLSSTELKCTSCSSNAIQSSNGLSCVCKSGYKYTKNGGGSQVICEACPSGTAPSADGWSCVNSAVTTCSSPNVLFDRDILGNSISRSCSSCVGLYTGVNNQCQLCTNVLNTNTGFLNCSCPGTFTSTNSACFSNTYKISSSVLKYSGISVTSGYLEANFQNAVALCQSKIDSGCQSLANMCVMTVYNLQSITNKDSSPCYWYSQMPQIQNNFYSKTTDFPALLYIIPTLFTTLSYDYQYKRGEFLQIILATYDISGQFLGFRNATQDGNLQLCSNSALKRSETYRFGTHFIETCSISVGQLFNQSRYLPLFYDPYISYKDSSGVAQIFAIPLKINNVVSTDGKSPNQAFDQNAWILSRRILLVDNFGSVSTPFQTNKTGSYVTYASSMRLVVVKKYSANFDINNDGKIYAPYLEVNMTTTSADKSDTYETVSFEVVYYNDSNYNDGFAYSLSVAMGVLCALSGLYAILRAFFWCRRSGISGFEGLVLLKTLAHACASISNVFFLVIFSVSLYFLLLYKNQTLFSVIPPNNDLFFVAYLISAFLLKLLEIIHIFINQCTVDIFLIDWERPKHLLAPKKVIERPRFDHIETSGDQNPNANPENTPLNSGVSIWRTYFIANEWNEIQTYRKTSLIFNLIIVLLFMEVIGFKNITFFDPFVIYNQSSDVYQAPNYRMFRFAVIVSIFGITAFIQWLYTILIYERVVEDKLRNYVDLCSVANVSVFILAHRQFGYYIHGRSVHGCADVSLAEMYVGLQKENSGSCAKRGLESDSMQQTYIMALPSNFRDGLDNVYRPSGPRLIDSSRTLQYLEVNKFLDKFINRTLNPRITFRFQDRKFFEDVFDGEFEDNSMEGRFYRDNGTSFGNILFYGQELSLITFDILLFCVVDLILQNTVLDAFITWGFVTILKMIRNGCGAHNLAKKTLVDRRFLI